MISTKSLQSMSVYGKDRHNILQGRGTFFLTYQHTAFVSELSPWYHACCRMALPTQGMGKLGKLAKGSRMLQVILVILSHSKSYRADLSRDFFWNCQVISVVPHLAELNYKTWRNRETWDPHIRETSEVPHRIFAVLLQKTQRGNVHGVHHLKHLATGL